MIANRRPIVERAEGLAAPRFAVTCRGAGSSGFVRIFGLPMLRQVCLGLGAAEQPELRQGLFTENRVLLALGDLDQLFLGLRVEQPEKNGSFGVRVSLRIQHRQLLTAASL